jgi:hypothetical protein
VSKKDFFDMCLEMPEILDSVSQEKFRDIKNP